MQAEAIVSSKGQVTLPAAMRAKLGIQPGSRIRFELREGELARSAHQRLPRDSQGL